jgi:transcriptional regulator with XRE-family HTH domain
MATHRQHPSLRQQPAHWYSDHRTLPADLAAELRAARERRGLSLRAAARLAGIDPGYLSRLERGLRAPRRPVVERLVVELDLDPATTEALIAEAADTRAVT